MNPRTITAAAAGALIAFLIGNYFGFGQSAAVAPVPPAVAAAPSQAAQTNTALRQDNERLVAEAFQLKAALERVDAANTELMKQHAAPAAAPFVASSPNIGLPIYELQRGVLNNLRQIDAARKQFQIQNGHSASSVRDLVGTRSFIKTVRTVGGEDYSAVPMDATQPMTVTTPDGVSVTYDPTGGTTTHLDIPPEVARVQELSAKVLKPSTSALQAYRAAHGGGNPPNEEAVLPYFATPEEAADFAEFIKAKRAAGL